MDSKLPLFNPHSDKDLKYPYDHDLKSVSFARINISPVSGINSVSSNVKGIGRVFKL